MDYNYVRMRNALKDGDLEKADRYKQLYETGKTQGKSVPVLNYVILILLFISILLGGYILLSESKLAETANAPAQTEVTP